MDYTVNEVKDMLALTDVPQGILEIFRADGRQSVIKLVDQYERRWLKSIAERERLLAMWQYEQRFHKQQLFPVAGTDEAGRGPLAGPVVAAAVILPYEIIIPGLNDSKKISEARREQLFDVICDTAVAYSYAVVEPKVIDEINIYQAARRAMYQALNSLDVKPGAIISDAMPLPEMACRVLAIERADSLSASVAAASIVAKVVRDRIMRELDNQYPQYGFAAHKGYGTEQHVSALREYGATVHHRRSFAPVSLMDKCSEVC